MKTTVKKRTVYNNAKTLYSKLLCIYCDGYNDITDEEKEKMGEKYNPKNLLIKGQRFIESKKEEESKSQLEKTCRKSKIKKKKQIINTYLIRRCLLLMMILMNLLICYH